MIDENPSTLNGAIKILEHLHKYVPVLEDGSLHTVPTNGDGGSVERMNDAHNARCTSLTETTRLEGCQEVPQEFHHWGLAKQVI